MALRSWKIEFYRDCARVAVATEKAFWCLSQRILENFAEGVLVGLAGAEHFHLPLCLLCRGKVAVLGTGLPVTCTQRTAGDL